MLTGEKIIKARTFIIEINIYKARVHILHSLSNNELQKYIEKYFPGASYERSSPQTAAALTFHQGTSLEEYAIDFSTPLKISSHLSHQTLSHEVFHITLEIMRSIGVELSLESEEAFTYLQGFIVGKIIEGIFNKEKYKCKTFS
jgi:hypothetical protein